MGPRAVYYKPANADRGEWSPGEGAEGEAPVATGSALVLASVYDASEMEANQEMASGLPPGTYARWRREGEEREARRVAERAKQIDANAADGGPEWKPGEAAKPETPAEVARRERREAREYAASRARWAREDAASARRAEREFSRKDHRAYRAGAEAGARVGLDPQVKSNNSKKLEG